MDHLLLIQEKLAVKDAGDQRGGCRGRKKKLKHICAVTSGKFTLSIRRSDKDT